MIFCRGDLGDSASGWVWFTWRHSTVVSSRYRIFPWTSTEPFWQSLWFPHPPCKPFTLTDHAPWQHAKYPRLRAAYEWAARCTCELSLATCSFSGEFNHFDLSSLNHDFFRRILTLKLAWGWMYPIHAASQLLILRTPAYTKMQILWIWHKLAEEALSFLTLGAFNIIFFGPLRKFIWVHMAWFACSSVWWFYFFSECVMNETFDGFCNKRGEREISNSLKFASLPSPIICLFIWNVFLSRFNWLLLLIASMWILTLL